MNDFVIGTLTKANNYDEFNKLGKQKIYENNSHNNIQFILQKYFFHL
jgi:hypothetical protein